MAQKSTREGLKKEYVDYLGNLIIEGKIKQDIKNFTDSLYPTKQSFNNLADSLASEIEARTSNDEMINQDIDEINNDVKSLQTKTRINYLRPAAQSTIVNNIIVTNNNDGTFTINSENKTGDIWYNVCNITLEKGTYKLVGCPEYDGTNTYLIRCNLGDGVAYDDYGNGVIFNITEKRTVSIYIHINGSYSNLLFKPMITNDLSATYDDFVSYDDSLVTGSSQYFFGGIDTSRVLVTNLSVNTYTAIEDCYVFIKKRIDVDSISVALDGVTVLNFKENIAISDVIPMKQGQTLTSTNMNISVFGVRR